MSFHIFSAPYGDQRKSDFTWIFPRLIKLQALSAQRLTAKIHHFWKTFAARHQRKFHRLRIRLDNTSTTERKNQVEKKEKRDKNMSFRLTESEYKIVHHQYEIEQIGGQSFTEWVLKKLISDGKEPKNTVAEQVKAIRNLMRMLEEAYLKNDAKE